MDGSGIVLGVLTSFDGGRLFGQVYGLTAPRVLALHGWRRDHRDFRLVLGGRTLGADSGDGPRRSPTNNGGQGSRSPSDAELADAPAPSIAIDLPGFGSTPPPEEPWGSEEYARAVARIFSDMERPVVIVGHSFGGRVAVRLAADHPDEVCGLVLTGAPLFPAASATGRGRPPRAARRYRMARTLARHGLIGDQRLEEMKQRFGSADYRAATGVMRDILVRSIAEERESAYDPCLAAIRCPVELLWGELDFDSPPAVAQKIATALSGPVAVRIQPGIGHLTPLLVPGELRKAVDRVSPWAEQ
ncbi:MAG: alpha/beta fold hydrolase [Acidimicrobiales bacterium]